MIDKDYNYLIYINRFFYILLILSSLTDEIIQYDWRKKPKRLSNLEFRRETFLSI